MPNMVIVVTSVEQDAAGALMFYNASLEDGRTFQGSGLLVQWNAASVQQSNDAIINDAKTQAQDRFGVTFGGADRIHLYGGRV